MKTILPKFKFKGAPTVINAPINFSKECVELGFTTAFDKKVKSKNTLFFVNNKTEFINFLNKNLNNIEPDSVLWFAYPKGTSGVQTDVNRDSLWALSEEYGITAVSAISINAIWSALRFRPIEWVGKK